MYSCCNRKGPGIFAGYQAFWIIVVIAIVIIWVHYGRWDGCRGGNCCPDNGGDGCGDGSNGCMNPCC
jgi:hypothetical protein